MVAYIGWILVGWVGIFFEVALANEPESLAPRSAVEVTGVPVPIRPVPVNPGYGMFMRCLSALTPPPKQAAATPDELRRRAQWLQFFVRPDSALVPEEQTFTAATPFLGSCPGGSAQRTSSCLYMLVAPNSCYYREYSPPPGNAAPLSFLVPLDSNRRVLVTAQEDPSSGADRLFSAVDASVQTGNERTPVAAAAILGSTNTDCDLNLGAQRAAINISLALRRLRTHVGVAVANGTFNASELAVVLAANSGCAALRENCRAAAHSPSRAFLSRFRQSQESTSMPPERTQFGQSMQTVCDEMVLLNNTAARGTSNSPLSRRRVEPTGHANSLR